MIDVPRMTDLVSQRRSTVFLAEGPQRRIIARTSRAAASVGIWWCGGGRIVAVIQRLEDFSTDQLSVDSDLGHVHEWAAVAKPLGEC